MNSKRLGKQTVKLNNPPCIIGAYSSVGVKEGQGPLAKYFDTVYDDDMLGEKTWEKAESRLVCDTIEGAMQKASKVPSDIQYIFSGDLLNQCVGSAFGIKNFNIPYFGLFGACSTMGESISLASMIIDGGFADYCIAATESHFCSAERQFRFPLEYGGVRTPTSQWTVTGSGAVVISSEKKDAPKVTHVTTGKIVDMGIVDANNMGAAMAPSAADTIYQHFEDTGRSPDYYDYIVTGDLGAVGASILIDFLKEKDIDITSNYVDCGMMIYDDEEQDTKAGGSGCGCSGSVFCGYYYKQLIDRKIEKILFIPTGALMSTTTAQQGDPIMGIAHCVAIEMGDRL